MNYKKQRKRVLAVARLIHATNCAVFKDYWTPGEELCNFACVDPLGAENMPRRDSYRCQGAEDAMNIANELADKGWLK